LSGFVGPNPYINISGVSIFIETAELFALYPILPHIEVNVVNGAAKLY